MPLLLREADVRQLVDSGDALQALDRASQRRVGQAIRV